MAGVRGSGDDVGLTNSEMLQEILFEEGDPNTWRESEWQWNSLDMVVKPRLVQPPAASQIAKGLRHSTAHPGPEGMPKAPPLLEDMPQCTTFLGDMSRNACDFSPNALSCSHSSFPLGMRNRPGGQDPQPQFGDREPGFVMPGVSSAHCVAAMEANQTSGGGYELHKDIPESKNVSRLPQMGSGALAGGAAAAMRACSFPGSGAVLGSAGVYQPMDQGGVFGYAYASGGTGNKTCCSMEEAKAVEGGGSSSTGLCLPADVPVLVSDTSNLQLVCQVTDCEKDLNNLKEYHQRYRVCDVHIKLPRVVKDGRLQRFCQQCGRFHDLNAFEGNRRSCRDQLNKHNARRRKRACQRLKPELAEVENIAEENSETGRFLQGLCKSPGHLRALRLLLGLPTNLALPPQSPIPASYTSRGPGAAGKCCKLCDCDVGMADVAAEDQSNELQDARPCVCPCNDAKKCSDALSDSVQPSPECSSHVAGIPSDKPTYNLARKMVNCKEDFNATFDSDERLERLSVKLFNKTPSSLPAGLKDDILSWLGSAPTMMEGMIAPGCVLLTVHLLLASHVAEQILMAGVQGLVAHLLQREQSEIWRSSTMVVQLGLETAVVVEGQLCCTMNLVGCSRAPRISDLHPVCVSRSSAQSVTIETASQCCDECRLLCRIPDFSLRVKTWHPQDAPHCFKLLVGETGGTQAAFVELACGAVQSEPRVLLLVDDDHVAEEINALAAGEGAGLHFAGKMNEFLLDVALVFQAVDGTHRHRIGLEELGKKARRLLAFACDHRCCGLADRVFPAATWGCVSADAAIQASMSTKGLSFLHRAVRSGSTAMVQKLMVWAWNNSAEFCSCGKGIHGITPLHLSALLEDDGLMAVTLLSCCGPKIFTTVASDDGVTPFHLALQMGHFRVDKLICSLQFHRELRCLNSALEDTCETCDSALPPLLLSIMACCGLCGARKSPAPQSPQAIDGTPTWEQNAISPAARKCPHSPETALTTLPVAASKFGPCDHEDSFVYSITAMCQTCHTDRVLVVF